MGIAGFDYTGVKGGLDINGIIQDYYIYAEEKVSAGDFVEFINGIAHKTIQTSKDTAISSYANYGVVLSACSLNKNKVFIAHRGSSSNYLYGTLCIIEGSIITPQTSTMLLSTTNSGYSVSVVALSSNTVFLAHSGDSNYSLYGMIVTIDGTTVTPGADTRIHSSENTGYLISLCVLPTDSVFIAHSYSSSYSIRGRVCSVSGTTITPGADTVISSTADTASFSSISAVTLNKDYVFVVRSSGSSNYYLESSLCSISGTTTTLRTNTTLVSTTYTGQYVRAVLLDNGNVFIAHGYGSSRYLYGIVCTISGTSVTKGTDNLIDNTYVSGQVINCVSLKGNKVFITHSKSSLNFLSMVVCTINNRTITVGTGIALNETEIPNIAYSISTMCLTDNRIMIVHRYGSSNHIYGQVWDIDETTNTPTNQIIDVEYETQIRKATAIPCDGVAKSNGIGGDDMTHKDKIGVHLPSTFYKQFNLAVNGDFSSGMSGWTIGGTNSPQSTTKISVSDGVLNCSVGSSTASHWVYIYQPQTLVAGHVYYFSTFAKYTLNSSGAGTTSVIEIRENPDSDDPTQWIKRGSTPDVWEEISRIVTVTSSTCRLHVGCYEKNANVTFAYKDIKLYDLTEMFGVGNIPSQEWCDTNL